MPYYLVEIEPVAGTSTKVSEILSTVEQVVTSNTANDSLKFKVFGENKFLFIGQGEEPQKVLDALNDQGNIANAINVKTVPVRPYEDFGREVLGIDKAITERSTRAFSDPQTVLFIRITIDFPGLGMEEFLKIWKEEATFGFTARSQAVMDFRAFKTIATRSVILIMNLPAAEIIDTGLHAAPFAMNPKTADGFRFPEVRELKQLPGKGSKSAQL